VFQEAKTKGNVVNFKVTILDSFRIKFVFKQNIDACALYAFVKNIKRQQVFFWQTTTKCQFCSGAAEETQKSHCFFLQKKTTRSCGILQRFLNNKLCF